MNPCVAHASVHTVTAAPCPLQWRFEENPPLQHLLTFIFFAQVAFILQMLWVEAPHPDQILHPLAILGIATVICSGFVFVVNGVSASVIAYLKRELVRRKLVTSMPVHSAALLKKWQDRSWQLIVHVSMTAFEIYVLCTDLSGVWQNPDLAWTPDPFTYKPTFAIRLLYIIQFVRGPCGGGALPPLSPRDIQSFPMPFAGRGPPPPSPRGLPLAPPLSCVPVVCVCAAPCPLCCVCLWWLL